MSSADVMKQNGLLDVLRQFFECEGSHGEDDMDIEEDERDIYFDVLQDYDPSLVVQNDCRGRFHLVLDLDGTLVHTMHKSVGPVDPNPDFEDEALDFFTFKRPGLDAFLKYCFSRFESVSIWTAGTEAYAEYVATNILPEGCTFMFILHRDFCSQHPLVQNALVKNLYDLWESQSGKELGISENNTIIIDDNDEACFCNLENAIIVNAWTKGEDDKLLSLMRYFDNTPARSARSLCYLLN